MKRILAIFLLLTPFTFLSGQPGALDTDFGDEGIVLYFDATYNTTPNAILLHSDTMQILTVGERFNGFGSQLLMLGYQNDGQTDTGFGYNNPFGNPTWGYPGIVHTDIPGSNREYAFAASLHFNGKIMVGGAANTGLDWLLARYHPNGDLDDTFAGSGYLKKDWGGADLVSSILVIDTIIVDGNTPPGNDTLMFTFLVGGTMDGDVGVARYLANGELDLTFGNEGTAKMGLSFFSQGGHLAIDSSGLIYVTGVDANTGEVALARLLANGMPDISFGDNGLVKIPMDINNPPSKLFVPPAKSFVALTPGGKPILLADQTTSFGQPFNLMIARLLQNGALDPGFGANGIVSASLGFGVHAEALLMQPDGRILVGGRSYINGVLDMFVAKFLPNGTPDAEFGNGGYAVSGLGVDLANTYALGLSLALQPDKKILLGGTYWNAGLEYLALVRFENSFDFTNTQVKEGLDIQPLQVFPNPVGDMLNLVIPAGKWGLIQMTDIFGRKISEWSLGENRFQTQLSLSGIPPGIYIVALSGQAGTRTVKIVKR